MWPPPAPTKQAAQIRDTQSQQRQPPLPFWIPSMDTSAVAGYDITAIQIYLCSDFVVIWPNE